MVFPRKKFRRFRSLLLAVIVPAYKTRSRAGGQPVLTKMCEQRCDRIGRPSRSCSVEDRANLKRRQWQKKGALGLFCDEPVNERTYGMVPQLAHALYLNQPSAF